MVPKTKSCVHTNSDNEIWSLIEKGFIGYAYKRALFASFHWLINQRAHVFGGNGSGIKQKNSVWKNNNNLEVRIRDN